MEKEVRFPVLLVTFRMVTALNPPNAEVTLTFPGARPVAKPASTDATVESDVVHVAEFVTFLFDPSLYVAVAVNCSVELTTTDAFVGASEIEVTTGPVVTPSVVDPLIPLNEADMFTLPAFTPVARPGLAPPAVCTVAMVGSEDVQLADVVTSLLVPSL
jgi:hypothetical protein